MMIKKPFGKMVLSIILVIVIAITPFSYVKAETYTMDDVYYKLRDILTVLNGYGQNIPTDGINDQIQDLQDLFDTIFVDNTYSYVGLTGTVDNRTFMDLMEVIASMGYSIPSRIMEGYYMRDQNGILVHMGGVNESIANVLNRLNLLNSSSSTIISDLQTIITDTASILTTLNAISTTLSSILTVDSNILNLETNFYNYIQNGTFKQDIDNAIDTITWNSVDSVSASNVGVRINGTNNEFTNTNINLNQDDAVLRLSLSNTITHHDRLFKLTIPYYIASQSSTIPWELNISSLYSRFNFDIYYTSSRVYGTTIYFRIDSTQAISNIYFLISGHGTLTYLSSLPFGLWYIESTDIEYWQILSYMDLHRFLLDYESVNSSELDKLKQDNQQFNTTLQNFNTIENQISTDFSNNLVTFNSNLTESTTMFNSLTNTVVWFSNQMQNIFNVSSDFKMLLIMPMVLGIALWFIGRGSFILRSSGKKGKESNKS